MLSNKIAVITGTGAGAGIGAAATHIFARENEYKATGMICSSPMWSRAAWAQERQGFL